MSDKMREAIEDYTPAVVMLSVYALFMLLAFLG